MKTFFVIFSVFLSSAAFAQKEKKVIYTCIMHPEVQMSKPGSCPKCGMELIKKTITVNKPMPKAQSQKPHTKSSPQAGMQENEVPKQKDTSMQHGMRMDNEEVAKRNESNVLSVTEKPTVFMQPGKIVRVDLYVTDSFVNFTGRKRHAYAINGSIPAPTLVFTEGDTAEIYLHNKLKKEETSLHWHGVILPNRFDGVPYLTTAKIAPGETHLYKFPVVQNGTYWYHSHTTLQEQAGMYGTLIFKKREDPQAKPDSQLFNA